MKNLLRVLTLWLVVTSSSAESTENGITPIYEVKPIGWVRKTDGRTTIEVDKQYQPFKGGNHMKYKRIIILCQDLGPSFCISVRTL